MPLRLENIVVVIAKFPRGPMDPLHNACAAKHSDAREDHLALMSALTREELGQGAEHRLAQSLQVFPRGPLKHFTEYPSSCSMFAKPKHFGFDIQLLHAPGRDAHDRPTLHRFHSPIKAIHVA